MPCTKECSNGNELACPLSSPQVEHHPLCGSAVSEQPPLFGLFSGIFGNVVQIQVNPSSKRTDS